MALSGWNPNNKLKLTLDGSKIDTDLTNFPVNITLSSVTGINGFDATAVFDELIIISGTKNIAITDSDDNQLYTEIERWDWDNEKANLWVKVPTIVSGTDTDLYLYYDATVSGNTTYIGDTGDAAAKSVWDSNFKAVWHMAQDPNGDVVDAIKDSSSNAYHATPSGSMVTADLVDAKIGKGIDFDGNDDYLSPGDVSMDFGTGGLTLEVIFKSANLGVIRDILWRHDDLNAHDPLIYFRLTATGNIEIYVRGQTNTGSNLNIISSTANYDDNALHHAAAVFDDPNDSGFIMIDGVNDGSQGSKTTTDIDFGQADLQIARLFQGWVPSDAEYFNGILDEIRISDIARSAAWLKATYYSNWDDFIVFQEEAPTTTWLTGWANRLQLTIDYTKINNILIDFPVNITLSSGTGQTGFDATAVFDELITISGTKNIAMTTKDGISQCYMEIERWDWGNEQANLWTKVPIVRSDEDTILYLYYDATVSGNTTYVGNTDETPAQNVWDDNFVGVWHMAQDPNGDVVDAIKDSTDNVHHGTPAGTMTTADLVDGRIGKAIDFDGTDDEISLGTNAALDLTSAFTYEAIFKTSTGANAQDIITKFDENGADFQMELHINVADGSVASNIYNSVLTAVNCNTNDGLGGSFDNNIYYYVAINIDISGDGRSRLFMDGVLNVTSATSITDINSLAATPTNIGERYNAAANIHMAGILDEIRISNIKRSDIWIKATYYSNWDDLITFSEEVAVTFIFSNPIPVDLSTVYGVTQQLYLTTTVTGSEPSYNYDATFYDAYDDSIIGSTTSGSASGQTVNELMTTVSATDYQWYVTAVSSGTEDTSSTYTFTNKFLCEGQTQISDVPASGVPVRLYRRSTGEYIGGATSAGVNGTFQIETDYNEYHYIVGLYTSDDTNAILHDWLIPSN